MPREEADGPWVGVALAEIASADWSFERAGAVRR
jgi:hypothetical protein